MIMPVLVFVTLTVFQLWLATKIPNETFHPGFILLGFSIPIPISISIVCYLLMKG